MGMKNQQLLGLYQVIMKWQFLVLILLAVDCRGTQICPTWFRLSSSTSECECGSKLNGAVKCNNMTEEVSIALEYCMTLSNVSGRLQLVAGNTNNVFIGRSPRGYTLVPENVSKLNEFMCKNSNRKGFLCGDCVSGYGYAPNSHGKECAECNTMYAVAIFSDIWHLAYDNMLCVDYCASPKFSIRLFISLHHLLSVSCCICKGLYWFVLHNG